MDKSAGKMQPGKDRKKGYCDIRQNWAAYDTVYLGFPIWYYAAPNIITSFCRNHDWSGKKIYFFATSGGSGIGKAAQKLEPFVKGGKIVDARRVTGAAELSDWKPVLK